MTKVINIDIMNAALNACPYPGGRLTLVSNDGLGICFLWRWCDSKGLGTSYGGAVDRATADDMAVSEVARQRVFERFTHAMIAGASR